MIKAKGGKKSNMSNQGCSHNKFASDPTPTAFQTYQTHPDVLLTSDCSTGNHHLKSTCSSCKWLHMNCINTHLDTLRMALGCC